MQTFQIKLVFLLIISLEYLHAKKNSLGIGFIHSSNIYVQNSDTNRVFPMINYTYKNFYIKGLKLGYKKNDYFSFIANPRFGSVKIDGMDTKKGTLEAGVNLTYPIDKYKLTFETLFDTLGVYNGYKSSVKVSRTFVKMPFIFIPNLGIEYEDKNLANYYYGVDTDKLYDPYTVDHTINTSLGMVTILFLNKKYSFNFIYNYKNLDDKISNSPIITKTNKSLVIVNLNYKF